MATYAEIMKERSKKWNCPELLDSAKKDIQKIPFSSPLMNYATYGGIPRGMITEFFGEEGGGKSTSAVDICYNAFQLFQKEFEEKVNNMRAQIASGKKELSGPLEDLLEQGPQKITYWDLEHSFDYKWAKRMGVTDDMLDVAQPGNIEGEEITQAVEDLVSTGEVGLMIIDSIPSLVPKQELEKKYGERTVAALAGLMTVFMRKMTPICARYNCALLLINQLRDSQVSEYIMQTPGGRAVKFYASLRMYFRRGEPLDFAGNKLLMSAENPAGYLINAKLYKHKSGAFDRKVASFYLMMDTGIRSDFDYAIMAINKYGIIKKSGGWFTFCDPETGEVLEQDGKAVKVNGQVRVYEYLQSHPDYYVKLQSYIDSDLRGEEEDTDE